MRWPWTGIEERLDALVHEMSATRADHGRIVEEHRAFTTELVLDMRRHADERERAVNQRLDEIHQESQRMLADHGEFMAEQRAGREALFRMMDRLGPGPGAAPA
jgi:hypothetical protein